MKKILHIVGAMNVGGTETMIMNLYKNIDREKVQFDFLYYVNDECFYDDEIKKLGGKIIKANSVQNSGVLKSVSELKKIIIENGPYDVVHAHTLFNCGIAMLASKLAGVKVRISHAHTNQETTFSLARKVYYKSMSTMINCNSTKFLGASKYAGSFLFGEKIVESNKYEFLPNFIEYEKILSSNKNLRKEFGIKENEFIIGTVGRFIPIKNQKLILEIAKNIKVENNIDFKILLVGDGDLKDELQRQVKDLGIEDKVIFTGYRKDVYDLVNIMDVFVLPSLFEGFGMVVVEAQVAGVPCIISDVIPEEVNLKMGLVQKVSLKDEVNIWVKKVLDVRNDKIHNKEIIENSLVKNGFMKDDIINQVYKIYGVK